MLTHREMRKLKDSAAKYMGEGKFKKASELYEKMYLANPEDIKIAHNLGDALRKAGNAKRALEIYTLLASNYAKNGFLLRGISLCKVILEIDPEHKATQKMLAALYARQYGMPGKDVKQRWFEKAEVKKTPKGAVKPSLKAEKPVMKKKKDFALSFEEPTVLDFEEPEVVEKKIAKEDIVMETLEEECTITGEEIAQLPNIPLFSELSKSAFIALLNRVVTKKTDPGELIIKEGEEGDSLYAIVKGSVKIYKKSTTGEKIQLAILREGEIFGEMALISGKPRTASVETIEMGELLVISKEVLNELTREYPSIGKVLKNFYRKRLLANLFTMSPIFKPLSDGDKQQLLSQFRALNFRRGTKILAEGENADGLYVIMQGEVEISRKENGKSTSLEVLREGAIFGEASILTRKPCQTTFTAHRNVTVLVLSRNKFNEVILTHPLVLETLSELATTEEAWGITSKKSPRKVDKRIILV